MKDRSENILEVRNLTVDFTTEDATVRAVDGLSFELKKGEIFGIVGESGSGKSVTGMSLLRLIPDPIGKIVSGEALFRGQDLLRIPIDELKRVRGRGIGIIFQEPMTALSPLVTVGYQIVETLLTHYSLTKEEAWSRGIEWLEKVGIPDPEQRMAVADVLFEVQRGVGQHHVAHIRHQIADDGVRLIVNRRNKISCVVYT